MSEIKVPVLGIKEQHNSLRAEIDTAVSGVIEKGIFIQGENVSAFEKEFAKYCECKHAIGVASGTDALFLSLKALGIGKGSEVITCSNSFVSTALAITMAGAKPVFVDVDGKNFNLDPSKLKTAINERTKAVIPIHLFGQPAPLKEIGEIADRHGLHIVEDACQAHGALYKGKKAGSLGATGCFSFYPTKNLGCLGDGGMITTNDSGLFEKLSLLHNYGQTKKYHYAIKGFNSRLDELQAAILRTKLKKLDSWNEKRRKNASAYSKLLSSKVEKPKEEKYASHVFHQYIIKPEKRGLLQEKLAKAGIETLIHYPVPIHFQKSFSEFSLGVGSLPVTEKLSEKILSLPVYPELSKGQIELVANTINS